MASWRVLMSNPVIWKPSVRDRQIFGRTDKFFNLSVRRTDTKIPIIVHWFYVGLIKNRPDRQNIGVTRLMNDWLIFSRNWQAICKCLLRVRVRHKHSPTRHGEWKFPLASTTWKSLAKLASMKLGCKYFGEYEIKLTRQIRLFTNTFILFLN